LLWDLITRPTLNLPAERASLAAAAFVFRIGLLDGNDAADIGWSRVPLGQLHGEMARAALDAAGVEVLTRRRVMRVEPGPVVVTEGDRLVADATVVALPHTVAPAVLPPGALGSLGSLGARADRGGLFELGVSPIVNVHLVFDRRVTDLPFAAAVRSPVEYVFDRSDSAGLARGQYLAVTLSAADRYLGMRQHELVPMMASALGELLPHAERASLVDALVTREREATFAVTPGTARLRSGPVTGAEGVFVAGAWTDTGWPATMEGAVRSGAAAAAAALTHLSARRPRAQEVAS
jgi:hydroxysqualene dehydroxylase